jgi:hypothetical protein
MSALERLRAREISGKSPTGEPTKPTKPPFDGFVGTPLAPFTNSRGADAFDNNEGGMDSDPGARRRRTKALAILATEPARCLAIVAEAGNPARVTIAIRGGSIGELTIPAEKYDAFALLALMQQHGNA